MTEDGLPSDEEPRRVWRPVPDPTTLTNELVSRAVLALREVLETKIDNNTRHTDIAIKALSDRLDDKIEGLTETVNVFKTAVNERFQLGDVQTEKAARDVKSAVDAAFAAAKEAVGEQNKSNALSIAKSEVATTKQIDQLGENLRISVKTSDDKYADLKDRIVAMEARSVGGLQQRSDINAWVWPLATLIIAAVAIAAGLIERSH